MHRNGTNTCQLHATALVAAVMAMALVGCPAPDPEEGDGGGGTAKLTVAFSSDTNTLRSLLLSQLKLSPGPVPVDDIASLVVTIEEIVLDRAGNKALLQAVDPGFKAQVTVFSGAVDVDLMNLRDVSEILSTAEVPAGVYTKIRLSISNPRLVLHEMPDTVWTNIHLTANSRLFVSEHFTLEKDTNNLILLDFGGIHLVRQGHGGHVLTPQLRANITVMDAEVIAQGVIVSVDLDAGLLVLALPEGEIFVIFDSAAIFLPGDADVPTGVPADLAPGALIEVSGLLTVDGDIIAEVIAVLDTP